MASTAALLVRSSIENKGFKLVAMKFKQVGFLVQNSFRDFNYHLFHQASVEHLEKHYADLSKKGFFRGLVTYMASGPVCAMVCVLDILAPLL